MAENSYKYFLKFVSDEVNLLLAGTKWCVSDEVYLLLAETK